MANPNIPEPLLNQREVILIVVSTVIVFIILWRVAGYFARIYFDSLRADIRKLFDMLDEIKKDCKSHATKIDEMYGRRSDK